MQSGNADQVPNTGTVKELPLPVGNGAFVADRQRRNHTGIGPALERVQDACANRLARPRNVVGRSAGEGVDPTVAVAIAYVPCGAQLVLEQPRLDVEAIGIDRAVWAFQAHRQVPALARVQFRSRVCGAIALPAGVPRQRQPRRSDGARRDDAVDSKHEARPAIRRLR